MKNAGAEPPFFCFRDETYRAGLPPAELALTEPNGLLAAGGSLRPGTLLDGYRQGIFPWYARGQPLLWWAPNPRTVFWPGQFHVSRSLARTLRRGEFTVSFDRDFSGVMHACGPQRTPPGETWITPAMLHAYTALHALGHAHSVECWRAGELVGGVYGVAVGQVFFGESMFSRISNASKVALAVLCRQLVVWNYALMDCQMDSAHLTSLGAQEISRPHFTELLARLCVAPPARGAWPSGLI
ncbi:MAG: leucyl/phenylalanyl-tRNA--protein transferase [Gammaproteobacteria bacterium]|nr:leucyl/phenylalanyl-tRNA--protein transferase [Gammaproteobacteria bacterium]